MAGKSYNHVVLVGRLGADPQLRSTPSGKSVCNFNLATNRRDKDETTDWHRIELWDSLADTASKYLKKGSQVLIEGRIANENYEKNGVKHYSYKIVASNMMFMDSKKSEENTSFQSNETKKYSQTQQDDFDGDEKQNDQGSYYIDDDFGNDKKNDDLPF